jgi:DNA-binding CsgD family transcriptional regulator/tetratricopeptide (TPR) repeat protein
VPLGTGAFVEREIELDALERLLASARDGTGGGVVVEGPPGIGKSSLLAAARAAAQDLRVVSARGSELERELPFGIVRQLLEPVLIGASDTEREGLLAGAAALAGPVLLAHDLDDGAEPPFSALHGLYWLAVNLAGTQPLLVVVDDAHWADLASLRWLVYLARRTEGVRLGLLLATRPAEPGATRELLDELAAIPDVAVMLPAHLSERAAGGLAAELLPGTPDPEFVAACHRATGGNPFLLRELLGEMARRGISPSRESAGLANQLSSQGVGRAVRARLRRLEPHCTALARAVAVLGDGVEPAIAARLAGVAEQDASRAADALADAAILEPGRPLAFVHPLLRSSVYAELSGGERADEHERAADVLADVGAAPDRIAIHLLASSPRGNADSVTILRRAAAGAGGRGAPDVAVAYLRRALAEPPPPDLRPTLAYELGAAALRAGDVDTAIEQLRAALPGLPVEQRAQAANMLGSALFLAHRPDEAVAELGTVIDELADGQREHGLRLQATRWTAARASLDAWRALRARGDRFAVAGETAATTGECLALAVAALHAVRERTAAEAQELARRALAQGRLLEDPGPESAGFWIAPLVLLWADALEDATRAATEAMDWANRHGSAPAFAMAARLRAFAWWRRGSLHEAEADATSALEHAELPGFPPYGYGALGNALLARGKLAEADEILRRAPFEPGSTRAVFYYLQARARLHAASRRPEEALEDLFACGRLEQDWEIRTPAFCNWRADAAPQLALLQRRDEALRLAREELERCRAFGAAGPLGAALRTLGNLEQGDAGIALLVQAVDVLATSPARLEHSLALLELGAASRRAGRRADARDPLRQALEVARACGADAVVARAHDELVAAGARPRRDPLESRNELTASELRVARMAADGMTNREIAQRLFLTENTIQTHLRSSFRKLDIGSRSQLARSLDPV